jgi:hypothetical protein
VGTKGFLCQNCKLVNLPTTDKNGIQKSFWRECQKDMKTYRKSDFKVCHVKFCECFGFLNFGNVECVEGIVEWCLFIQYMLIFTSCSYGVCLA